jgi:hypothetical protein
VTPAIRHATSKPGAQARICGLLHGGVCSSRPPRRQRLCDPTPTRPIRPPRSTLASPFGSGGATSFGAAASLLDHPTASPFVAFAPLAAQNAAATPLWCCGPRPPAVARGGGAGDAARRSGGSAAAAAPSVISARLPAWRRRPTTAQPTTAQRIPTARRSRCAGARSVKKGEARPTLLRPRRLRFGFPAFSAT